MSVFSGPLTGRKIGAIFVGGFAAILAANLTLLYYALGTFPGIEVKNTYADSMGFEARREAQELLNWKTSARFDGHDLILSITDASGNPVRVQSLKTILGIATLEGEDHPVDLEFNGTDYRLTTDLKPGNWQLRIHAIAQDGTAFRQFLPLDYRRNG